MNTKTLASKIYKAFFKAGFNVGPLLDVTSTFDFLSSFRFLIDKGVEYTCFSSSYKNLVKAYTSQYTGKTFVYVDCYPDIYNRVLSILTPFINDIDFSITC
jgi:uncharacterized membrane protein YjgN (DUF898 family)